MSVEEPEPVEVVAVVSLEAPEQAVAYSALEVELAPKQKLK